jgi:hypothetical protein
MIFTGNNRYITCLNVLTTPNTHNQFVKRIPKSPGHRTVEQKVD